MADVLNLNTSILAYDDTDAGTTNNPLRRAADWVRRFSNLSISKPKSQVFTVEPGATLSLFSGVRPTLIDGTTAFDLSLLSIATSTYRVTRTAGTAPGFRTARALGADATSQITVAVNNNATALFTASGGTLVSFATVQVGDILRVAGVSTGDPASPFASSNEGYWVVLAATPTTITCRRLPAADFVGVGEIVVLGAGFATGFIVYSAAGVQIGDKVEVSAGFSAVTRRTFTVSQVAPLFVEFVSALPLPLEAGVIPGATGMVFYTAAKRVLYLETDQDLVVRPNGSTADTTVLNPFVPGVNDKVASYQQIGNVYSLSVVNRSETDTAEVFVFTAE